MVWATRTTRPGGLRLRPGTARAGSKVWAETRKVPPPLLFAAASLRLARAHPRESRRTRPAAFQVQVTRSQRRSEAVSDLSTHRSASETRQLQLYDSQPLALRKCSPSLPSDCQGAGARPRPLSTNYKARSIQTIDILYESVSPRTPQRVPINP